jgi:HSP20 family protein
MAERGLTPWTGLRGLTPFGRDPFFSFRREMDRLFDDFLAPTAAEPRSFAGALTRGAFPSVDIEETKDGYKVSAELPGLDEKDVQISLRDNVLTISGEKREETTEKDGGRTWSERVYGRFERVIPLSAEIDADKVEAKFKNGVLTIMLPRSAKAQDQTRQIEIKPG